MAKNLILKTYKDLNNSIDLLSASFNKYVPYDSQKEYFPDDLEFYDSLSFRFEKSIEMIFSFLRGLELYLFSKKSETLRDLLLKFKKLEVVDSVDFWMEARLLRNKISHTYKPEEIREMYQLVYEMSDEIFILRDKIKKFLVLKKVINE